MRPASRSPETVDVRDTMRAGLKAADTMRTCQSPAALCIGNLDNAACSRVVPACE
jgi:hypothetical protein